MDNLTIGLAIFGAVFGSGGAYTLIKIGLELGKFKKDFLTEAKFSKFKEAHDLHSEKFMDKIFAKLEEINLSVRELEVKAGIKNNPK